MSKVEPIRLGKESVRPSLAHERRREFSLPWVRLSFVLAVLIPALCVGIYYFGIATPQFVTSSQFAVRGVSESPLSTLGLATVLGSNPQSSDSYIVVNYVESTQLLRDLMDEGIDLRQFYAKENIDFLQRIEADQPLEYFLKYWRDKVDISFNSTTGNVTLNVRAFSSTDAFAIGNAVMAACERQVARLSEGARVQLIAAARDEVERTQTRLLEVRDRFQAFREREQVVGIEQLASIEQQVISELETRLTELETRKGAISDLSSNSPTMVVLDSQIEAIKRQLEERRRRLGTGKAGAETAAGAGDNLSAVATAFRQLSLELEFAETAYTQSLASLESALADARKQDRYFAVFNSPHAPQVPTEPDRPFYTLLFTLGFAALWGIAVLVIRAIRDRAV